MLELSTSVLIMTALFNAGLTFFILRGNWRNPANLFFGIFLSALSLWAFALTGFQTTQNPTLLLYFGKAAYAFALLISMSFYLFSIAFPEGRLPEKKTMRLLGILFGLFVLGLFEPFYLIQHISPSEVDRGVQLGLVEYIGFASLFCLFFVGGLGRIWRKYAQPRSTARKQLLVIGISVTIAGVGGMYYNLVLASPFFKDFHYLWTGPLFTTFIAVMIMYAVFRFHLFNAKVIATELLIAILCIFTFLRTLLASDTQERFLDAGLFALSSIIGLLLVRSVYKEVRSRELIEEQEKELEERNTRLQELDRQKSEFLSFASHQLRTPLTAIKWNSGAVLDGTYGAVPDNLREPIESVLDESTRMSVLVNDYLNVSRIEQGRIEYHFAPTNLCEVVKTIAEEMEPQLKKKGLALTVNVPPGPVTVWGDRGKLTEIIGNLIDNALKYTPQGHIAITLRLTEKQHVLIEISDTGIGIDKENLGRIFAKFVRADNAAEVNSGGSGLGLFIVRTFVTAHKGVISVSSEGIGKGTTFTVDLPLWDGKTTE